MRTTDRPTVLTLNPAYGTGSLYAATMRPWADELAAFNADRAAMDADHRERMRLRDMRALGFGARESYCG